MEDSPIRPCFGFAGPSGRGMLAGLLTLATASVALGGPLKTTYTQEVSVTVTEVDQNGTRTVPVSSNSSTLTCDSLCFNIPPNGLHLSPGISDVANGNYNARTTGNYSSIGILANGINGYNSFASAALHTYVTFIPTFLPQTQGIGGVLNLGTLGTYSYVEGYGLVVQGHFTSSFVNERPGFTEVTIQAGANFYPTANPGLGFLGPASSSAGFSANCSADAETATLGAVSIAGSTQFAAALGSACSRGGFSDQFSFILGMSPQQAQDTNAGIPETFDLSLGLAGTASAPRLRSGSDSALVNASDTLAIDSVAIVDSDGRVIPAFAFISVDGNPFASPTAAPDPGVPATGIPEPAPGWAFAIGALCCAAFGRRGVLGWKARPTVP